MRRLEAEGECETIALLLTYFPILSVHVLLSSVDYDLAQEFKIERIRSTRARACTRVEELPRNYKVSLTTFSW